jgi:DNA polymerase IV
MRRPQEPERLYLDFDGFFASVEQLARPSLRGRPVGVVPFAGAVHTCVIACSKEAKAFGVKNVMNVEEARILCPDIILIPQSPDLYRRAHNALLSEISAVIPIDAVKSIDELTCNIAVSDRGDPQALGRRIKTRIRDHIGAVLTCSIGHAANRQLAKMACKVGKKAGTTYGDGNMVWWPADHPGPLLAVTLEDVPGIGTRLLQRLELAGIRDMAGLLATAPKQLRGLWGNVNGERLWYALHGYDIQAQPSSRGMYGHGRVLPPGERTLEHARMASRLLLVKAARRMRRDGYYAGRLSLWLDVMGGQPCGAQTTLPSVRDDQAVLSAVGVLWQRVTLPARARIMRVHVTLMELTYATERQTDMLLDDDRERQKWEAVTTAIDAMNRRYGRTVLSVGPWSPPSGGYAGGKISYTRIPRAEDFW